MGRGSGIENEDSTEETQIQQLCLCPLFPTSTSDHFTTSISNITDIKHQIGQSACSSPVAVLHCHKHQQPTTHPQGQCRVRAQTEILHNLQLAPNSPSIASNNPDRVESVPFHLKTSGGTLASDLDDFSQQLSDFGQRFSQQLSGFEQRITSEVDDVKDKLGGQRFTSMADNVMNKLSEMQNAEDGTNKALKDLKDEMASNHEELVRLLGDCSRALQQESEAAASHNSQ